MVATIAITSAAYCGAMHLLRRARRYAPPGKVRSALDATLRVMGGGGGPVEPF